MFCGNAALFVFLSRKCLLRLRVLHVLDRHISISVNTSVNVD